METNNWKNNWSWRSIIVITISLSFILYVLCCGIAIFYKSPVEEEIITIPKKELYTIYRAAYTSGQYAQVCKFAFGKDLTESWKADSTEFCEKYLNMK